MLCHKKYDLLLKITFLLFLNSCSSLVSKLAQNGPQLISSRRTSPNGAIQAIKKRQTVRNPMTRQKRLVIIVVVSGPIRRRAKEHVQDLEPYVTIAKRRNHYEAMCSIKTAEEKSAGATEGSVPQVQTQYEDNSDDSSEYVFSVDKTQSSSPLFKVKVEGKIMEMLADFGV